MDKESVEGCVGAGFYVPSEEINGISPERGKGGKGERERVPTSLC